MSAEFDLVELHGSNLTSLTTVEGETGIRNQDTSASYSAYPVPIPDDAASGTNRSYETWLQLRCVVPPNNSCTNFKVWKDVNEICGVKIYMGYCSSTPSAPSKSDSIYAVHTCDDNYYDRSNALDWDTETSITAQGDYTYLLAIQMDVTADAINAQSNTDSGIWKYIYDEA